MHVDLMRFSSTKLMYLKKIMVRVAFLRFIYVVVCSIVNVMIKHIKIKTMFNNKAKINYMFKRLTDIAQLSVRQNITIFIINVINERTRFFDMCETVLISIDSITISISVFVIKRSNYEFFLKDSFSDCSYKNDELFEMILYSLNEKKRVNFLKVLAEHVNNKQKSMFAMKFLNV